MKLCPAPNVSKPARDREPAAPPQRTLRRPLSFLSLTLLLASLSMIHATGAGAGEVQWSVNVGSGVHVYSSGGRPSHRDRGVYEASACGSSSRHGYSRDESYDRGRRHWGRSAYRYPTPVVVVRPAPCPTPYVVRRSFNYRPLVSGPSRYGGSRCDDGYGRGSRRW